MKLIVFTSSFHIGASVTLRQILKSGEFEVVGIVHHQVVSPDLKSIRRIRKMIGRAGLIFILKTGVINVLQKVGLFFARLVKDWNKRKLFDVDELALKYNIPLLITDNVNSSRSVHFVRSKNPDLLVSCFLLQIVKKELLAIPKSGAINIHPALLPKFPGSWTNFWVLFHGEKRAGATVHFMNEELDAGDIILQKSFRIKKIESLQCFTRKMAQFSADVLLQALRKLKQQSFSPKKMKPSQRYFTLPSKKEVEASRKIFPFVHFRRFIQWF